MKIAYLFLGLTMSSLSFAQTYAEAQEGAIREFRAQQEKAMSKFKEEHKEWNKLPNDDYAAYYSEWENKNLQGEMKIRQDFCEKDAKLCLDDKEKDAIAAQGRVAIKVVELRNEYAKTNPNKVDQAKVNEEIDRAAKINLCQHHSTDCDKLAKKDIDLVEQLKRRDAKIEGMESEFAVKKPEWKDKKGDNDVVEFKIRKENELLGLNLKLNDTLCHQYPKDKEFCLEGTGKIEDMQADTDKANCLHKRVHQLYNVAKDELSSKEKILDAGHDAQWNSLEKKDCKYLLTQDRLGESITPPAPVVVVAPAPKEEILGDNEDENNPKNFRPETCKWVTDLPRKISYLPGCGSKGACIGYVVCDRKEGNGKFVRTSTCASQLCGSSDDDAVKCTKQGGYYTKKAKDESKEFVSEKLKRIFSGAVKQ